MESENDKYSKIFENYYTSSVYRKLHANESLGVTQEYNQDNRDKLFDDGKLRSEYKNETFNENKTITDSLSGKKIHKSHTAAKNKYKQGSDSSEWSNYASETDHIVSLKRGHERLKKNPFLSDQDVQSILNDKRYNYRETSKKYNSSKRESSDFSKIDELSNKGKIQVIKDNVKAETGIAVKTTILTTKNVGNEFSQGAAQSLEASAIPIMVEGVHNLFMVASGEKEFNEAAKDMGKLTTNIAVTGGGVKVATTTLTNVMKNSSVEALEKVANSNQVAQIITVALIVKDSVIKYANGDITGEEFFCEIGEKGVGLIAGAIGFEVGKDVGTIAGAAIGQTLIPIPVLGAAVGAAVGAAIGSFVGSMVISIASSEIYKYTIGLKDAYKSIDKYEDKLSKLNALANAALSEMEYQRSVLKEIVAEEFKEWDRQFNNGFDLIFKSALSDDATGIAMGLDNILNVFGENVRFKTYEEFDEFFMDENSVFSF